MLADAATANHDGVRSIVGTGHAKNARRPALRTGGRGRLDVVAAWIIFSAACAVLGWVLSAVRQLNEVGYLTALALVLGTAVVWLLSANRLPRALIATRAVFVRWRSHARRFRQPLPLLYLVFVLLDLLGGVLNAPTNYDALTYRLPRILHWWAAGQWHWIITPNPRMNYSATGFEWLMTPILALTLSDRLVFLLNIVAYTLLPGLVFSVFRQLGVGPRVAWYWMWIMPAAYCFALQAGGIGNDAFSAVYGLAALHFTLRAIEQRQIRDVWLAALAAALLTGAKASNIPLLLPCLLAAYPAARLLRQHIVGTAAVALIALLVSFVPVAILNRTYTGDWTGAPNNSEELLVRSPLIGLVGNTLELTAQSLQPPVFPGARQVRAMISDSLPEPFRAALKHDFPRFMLELGELPQEDSAGLGLGLTVLAVLALCAPVIERSSRRGPIRFHAPGTGFLVGIGAWISCLFLMGTLGSEGMPRLMSAYYPLLLLPLLLSSANATLVRRGWWQATATICAASTLFALILTPARPLWPAEMVIARLVDAAPDNAQVARINEVFSAYRHRHDLLAPLREHLPADVRMVGLIADGNDSELALWQPFGQREVVELIGEDVDADMLSAFEGSPEAWIVLKVAALSRSGKSLPTWVDENGGRVVYRATITSTVLEGPMDWVLVELPRQS